MKKFIALGLAAAGVILALNKKSGGTPTGSWAAATDRL